MSSVDCKTVLGAGQGPEEEGFVMSRQILLVDAAKYMGPRRKNGFYLLRDEAQD